MKGLLADANVIGYVESLAEAMQTPEWIEFWEQLHLELFHFDDVGLGPKSKDVVIWRTCQAEGLVLVTDNRNSNSPDSLGAAIAQFNQSDSLPVFTIADLGKISASREYAERVVIRVYDYLIRIDELLGTGRLYLP